MIEFINGLRIQWITTLDEFFLFQKNGADDSVKLAVLTVRS